MPFVLSCVVPFRAKPSSFSFYTNSSLKFLSANNVDTHFFLSTACPSVLIGLFTISSATIVQATNLVQQKKSGYWCAGATGYRHPFFYLVVIELLTAVFCVKKEKIPVLYTVNLTKYNIILIKHNDNIILARQFGPIVLLIKFP